MGASASKLVGREEAAKYESETTVELRGIDLGPCGLDLFLVDLFVPPIMLRSLRAEPIVGIEQTPGSAEGRMRPKYDRGESGRDNFLDKGHVIYVPKVEGWYDLVSSFPTDKGVNEPWTFKSVQVQVVGNGADAKIIGRQYPQMIEAFGGEPIRQNVQATATGPTSTL